MKTPAFLTLLITLLVGRVVESKPSTLDLSINDDLSYPRSSEIRMDDNETDLERSLQSTVPVTIYIKTDQDPAATFWTLRRTSTGDIVDSRPAGFYFVPFEVSVHEVNLIVGVDYQFTIFDDRNIGFQGYFEIVTGRTNIFKYPKENVLVKRYGFSGPTFSSRFLARLPKSVVPTPTAPPSVPTPAPTGCEEDINYNVQQNAFKKNPLFTTALEVLGKSEAICNSHTTYKDCTNESREDCQWIFLTQGYRSGKCRVDPIAKCLERGDCVCYTEDFQGGTSDGILFHAPISVTARDISVNSGDVVYSETYEFPAVQNSKHPQDDTFFISKVDFTGRQIRYIFEANNPMKLEKSRTFYFKLHYLYTDLPMVGTIFEGLGLKVTINTASGTQIININGCPYRLPKRLRVWTCSQIAITPNTLYVAGEPIRRTFELETPTVEGDVLIIGSFSGELFDFRVYSGESSQFQVYEGGARCAGPNDPATIKKLEDIETQFLVNSCSSINPELWGKVPADGIQTYGSSAFATLWVAPEKNPTNENEYLNIPEGFFDEQYFFQNSKLQSYQWERHYFENDMIAFVLEPYRYFTSDETLDYSLKTFNNPCRYIHQLNNYWEFPLYDPGVVPKWTVESYVGYAGGSSDVVFDLGMLYRNGNTGYYGFGFFTHEAFHEFHATLVITYDAQSSGWLQESGAESATALLFPGRGRILASVALAPAWPLGFPQTDYNDGQDEVVARNPHIFQPQLSLADRVRGGHYYGTWVIWWFLSEQAGLPHLLGQMFSIDRTIQAFWHGKLFVIRLLLHANDIDLGDAWMIYVAHARTWDFRNGDLLSDNERIDFEGLRNDGTIPPTTTLEGRKTHAKISPTRGTKGLFIAGPKIFRPTPFSWNCLTSTNIAPGKVIGITLSWNEGMGFDPSVSLPSIIDQHKGCDDDVRFFSGMVVLFNAKTNERRYWKIKGKKPPTLYIETGSSGPVTMHILVMPTPPVDYAGGRSLEIDKQISPLPIYTYKYKVDILSAVPSKQTISNPAGKAFGIVEFDSSLAKGWFTSKCSCLDDPENPNSGSLCIDPKFTTKSSSSLTCFSGMSSITVEGKGKMTMDDLKIGDRVLVDTTGNYEEVFSFGHYDPSRIGEYLLIQPFNLEMSKDHMIFIAGGSAVPASHLKVGDQLESGDRITAIKHVTRKGAYAPFTRSGSIVVNGVRASTYISFQMSKTLLVGGFPTPFTFQWLSHAFHAPHRIWCIHYGASSCKEEKYNQSGLSSWVESPFHIANWLLRQPPWILAILIIPLVCILCCFIIMEIIILYWKLALLLSCIMIMMRNLSLKVKQAS
jgi:Hint module